MTTTHGTRYAVLDSHTLGCIFPEQPDVFQILSSDIHGLDWTKGTTVIGNRPVRSATLADFDTFRVVPPREFTEKAR